MIKRGTAPFMECSTKGDRRFSAFCARIRRRGNRSVEEIYQASKVFENGVTGLTWRQAKGKRAVNMPEVADLYRLLWHEYIAENPELLGVLKNATGLSDMFGRAGCQCQATILWEIRSEV